MKYCTRCLYPDTKPDLFFNEAGVCSACQAYEHRREINWGDREAQFILLAEKQKKMASFLSADYDCVIPVSGGKDSHFQLLTALKYGLKPLAVNATTCSLTPLGRRNLDNLKNYADVLEVSVNKPLRRKLNRVGLLEIGDCSWPEHVTIFTIPFIIADKFDIPLIIWGENPQNEYGGPEESQQVEVLNGEEWLNEFGGLNGLRVNDLIDRGVIPLPDKHLFEYPSCAFGVTSVFLGQYFPWDGFYNAKVAKANGFEENHKIVEGTGFKYENLDNYQTGMRDYLKYLKFGFGRCTDIVSNHMRRHHMTRQQGVKHVNQHEGDWPATYLDKSLESILGEFGTTIDEFIGVCDQFANRELFDFRPLSGLYEPKFQVGRGMK